MAHHRAQHPYGVVAQGQLPLRELGPDAVELDLSLQHRCLPYTVKPLQPVLDANRSNLSME